MADKKIEWRRKSDGFRVQATEAEIANIVGGEDYEKLADYTKAQFAAAAPAPAAKPAKADKA